MLQVRVRIQTEALLKLLQPHRAKWVRVPRLDFTAVQESRVRVVSTEKLVVRDAIKTQKHLVHGPSLAFGPLENSEAHSPMAPNGIRIHKVGRCPVSEAINH